MKIDRKNYNFLFVSPSFRFVCRFISKKENPRRKNKYPTLFRLAEKMAKTRKNKKREKKMECGA